MLVSNKKRIYCFDIIKLISISIIYIYHVVMDMYVVHPMYNMKFIENLLIRPNVNLVMVAVALFIFISGATLTLSYKGENLFEFYKKRLTRVLLPFYISYFIYFIIKVLTYKTYHLFGNVQKWKILFTMIGMDEYLYANGVSTFSLGVGEWFLGCIILCYIIFPFLKKANDKNKKLTFILMSIWFLFINYSYNVFNFKIVPHMNFLCQVYNFYLGIYFASEQILYRMKKWSVVVSVPVIIFLYFYSLHINIPDNLKTSIISVATIISFYSIEKFLIKINILNLILKVFNSISLEIYLIHHFIIYQIDYMLGYRRLKGIETLLVLIVNLVITLILSFFVNAFCKRINAIMYTSNNK